MSSFTRMDVIPGRLLGGVLLVACLFALFVPGRAAAAPALQSEVARATTVSGVLNPASYHYLGLEPSLRDGTIVLTIALEPATDKDLRGAVNFIVLTEDGLRRVLAGADPADLDIAASAPLQFDPIGNKYQAVFKASGKGPYTVVVYNTGGKSGGYSLTALNGVLLDDQGQTTTVVAAPKPFVPTTLTSTSTPTETLQARVDASRASPLAVSAATGPVTQAAPAVNALRLSGTLYPGLSRHFFAVKPAVRDGRVGIDMLYEPQGRATEGLVNFWVIDADGMRRFVYGADPETTEIATGFPEPFNPNRNEVVADFKASGSDEYTIVPFSEALETVTYVMNVAGGELIDRYGQTNEAKAALAEFAALAGAAGSAASAGTADADAAAGGLALTIPGAVGVTLISTAGSTAGEDATEAALAGAAEAAAGNAAAAGQSRTVTQVSGELPNAFAHNYWTLLPTIRDGAVVLTMDYAPRDQKALKDHINFWVVDEDGMRRIIAGARPEDLALAGGSEVRFGPDKGKLQAAFRASGRGQYAVIVYNDANVPATYSMESSGGVLLAPAPESELLPILP
jgi:hypothetical protein